MSNYKIHLCRFDTVSDLRGKDRNYENIKKAVIKAGKFSCFEVNGRKDAIIFTNLLKDPDIKVIDMEYPWIGIRKR